MEMGRRKMIWGGGPPLGFYKRKPLTWPGNEPLMVIGPPGSFKTVGIVIPTLLDTELPAKRSFLVFDPKGEVTAVCLKWLQYVYGPENVDIINPYGVLTDIRPDLKSCGWNPIGDLDVNSPTFTDETAARANASIKTESNETQKFFPDAGRTGVDGVMQEEVREAVKEGRPPDFSKIRDFFAKDGKKLSADVKRIMAKNDRD